MRFYNQQHRFYCGVDLHARTMYLCILDDAGQVVFDQNLAAEPDAFLQAITSFLDNLIVGVECLFCWYWLADLCIREKIGNPHLRWAFAEAACLFLRQSERAKKWLKRQEKKRGKGKALAILAAKLGRAVYMGSQGGPADQRKSTQTEKQQKSDSKQTRTRNRQRNPAAYPMSQRQ